MFIPFQSYDLHTHILFVLSIRLIKINIVLFLIKSTAEKKKTTMDSDNVGDAILMKKKQQVRKRVSLFILKIIA